MKDTMLVAHWYAPEEVKAMADYVGDSLGLVQAVQDEKPKRLIFAGVRFMAETAKIMLPDTDVIIPDYNATCSLVTQTNVNSLEHWVNWNRDAEARWGRDTTHIMYINSSVEMKALADIIVTSANVVDIIKAEIDKGKRILFTPDYNMGRYIMNTFDTEMKLWSSLCDVHDGFNLESLEQEMRGWTDGNKYLLAHPESQFEILDKADFVGSTNSMLQWIKDFPHKVGTIWVATEEGLLHDMRRARPELDIRPAMGYKGCQCNQCPYMKMNTRAAVNTALMGVGGRAINYISDELAEAARKPIERMLEFGK